jgi:hypothetical protein
LSITTIGEVVEGRQGEQPAVRELNVLATDEAEAKFARGSYVMLM